MKTNSENMNRKVYLDCNATSPILKEACKAALCSMEKVYGNPSSSHIAGAEAKFILEHARLQASKLLDVKTNEIYFTSGATEAIQISVLSVLNWLKEKIKKEENFKFKKILISKTEHKAVYNSVIHWCKILGLQNPIILINVNEKGHLNLDEIEHHVQDTIFICTMAVNNETGLITHLRKVEDIIRKIDHHIFWLVDCVQALGKIELNFHKTSVDYATFSGHKVHAPKGIGFLFLRESAPQCSLIVGGGQERGIRSGTENHPGIAAIGVVLEKLNNIKNGKQENEFRTKSELLEYRKLLIEALQQAFPNMQINNDLENSVATTIHFSIFGISAKELMRVFDAAGISVSGGSACNSKSQEHSHVLEAMGLCEWRKASGIRLSFGLTTTKDEILLAEKNILAAGKALRNACLNLACQVENDGGDIIPEQNIIHGIMLLQYDSANTWFIVDMNTKNCLIIDPTLQSIERLSSYISCKNLSVQAVLDTHSHADHESARKLLLEKLNLKDDAFDNLGWNSNSSFLNFKSESWEVEKLETPGHTLDSVTYLLLNKMDLKNIECAFIGDTILIGGLGRSDFKISNSDKYYETLKLIDKKLSNETLLYPAHDYESFLFTLWGVEKNTNELLKKLLNPFQIMSITDFCKEKSIIDSELSSTNLQGKIICGLIQPELLYNNSLPLLSIDEVNDTEFLVIDIREKAESLLFKNWEIFKFKNCPLNIPVSYFMNFISSLMKNNCDYNKKIALLCSTGNRSLSLAKSLRRIGFNNVWSITGGVAFSQLKVDNLESSFF